MDKVILEHLTGLNKVMKIFKIKNYSKENLEVMKFVSSEINKINIKPQNLNECMYNREQLIGTGLSTLKIYDSSIIEYSHSILTSRKLLLVNPPCDFNTNIVFSARPLDNGEYEVDKESGMVDHFKLSKTSCLSDIIWYGHECIHACKDTMYDEYANLRRYSDVLPLFHELVTSINLNDEIFNEWVKVRYNFLKTNIMQVEETLKLKKKDRSNAELYDVQIGMAGQYLTSFYYAMILFNMYLLVPNRVLEQVNKVLKREKTTEEMLMDLNILKPTNNLNNVFLSTNGKFSKFLRR